MCRISICTNFRNWWTHYEATAKAQWCIEGELRAYILFRKKYVASLLDNVPNYLVVGCIIQKRTYKSIYCFLKNKSISILKHVFSFPNRIYKENMAAKICQESTGLSAWNYGTHLEFWINKKHSLKESLKSNQDT